MCSFLGVHSSKFKRNGRLNPIGATRTPHIRSVGHNLAFAGPGGFEIPRDQLLPQEPEPEEPAETEERPQLSEDEALERVSNYILSMRDELSPPKP